MEHEVKLETISFIFYEMNRWYSLNIKIYIVKVGS